MSNPISPSPAVRQAVSVKTAYPLWKNIGRAIGTMLALVFLALGTAHPAQAELRRDLAMPSHPLTLKTSIRVNGASSPVPGSLTLQKPKDPVLLRIGVMANGLPPFDLVGIDGNYEGISADYLAMIASTLHAKVEVRAYATRDAALYDLSHDAIDVVATDPGQTRPAQGAIGFMPNQIIEIATRSTAHKLVGNQTLGYVNGQLDPQAILAAYPGRKLQSYATLLDALTQLSLGADVVLLSNATAASYITAQYGIPNLVAVNVSRLSVGDLSFLVRDPALRARFDAAISAIPKPTRLAISTHWVPTTLMPHFDKALNLTAEESAWIAAHPVVRYRATNDRVPFVFSDEHGESVGLSVQVLDQIEERTGLRFEPVRADGNNRPDHPGAPTIQPIVPVDGPSVRADGLTITEPYFQGYWAIVAHVRQRGINNILDLAGKRVAVVLPNPIIDRLRATVPLQVVKAASYRDAYRMVATGIADATLGNMLTANYLIRESYPEVLRIVAPISGTPLNVGIGVPADEPMLLAILNKALLSLSREDINALRLRWSEPQSIASSTETLPSWAWFSLAAGLVLLAISLLWSQSLRQQIQRRRRMETVLHEQLAFQTSILDAIPQPIYLRDADLRLMTCNAAFERALGCGRKQMRGRTIDQMPLKLGDIPLSLQTYRKVLATGEAATLDRTLMIEGKERIVLNWVEPLRNATGGVVGIIGGWIDMTERQQMVTELASAKDRAEAANRAKSAFLASISHEIRTPMNAILGMLELTLQDKRLPDDDRLQVETAQESAKSLIGLINDILDASKMEAGKFVLTPQPAPLRQLVGDVTSLFGLAAARKGVQLEAIVDDAVAPCHMVDPLRFKQVLNNLVSNAVRFTDRGSVVIRLGATNLTPDRQSLTFSVSDTGTGIPEGGLKKLFQPFTQIGDTKRSAGGTGLGLSICQRLVTKMHGTIGITSEVGKGTTVTATIELPIVAEIAPVPQSDQRIQPSTKPGNTLHVLIVDDHAPNRILLQRQLEKLGHCAVTASDGCEALEKLADASFDLIICDYSMPNMDGPTLTRTIRSSDLPYRTLPILGYTASAQPEIRAHAIECGMDAVMIKPVDMATLETTLATTVSRRAHPGLPGLSGLALAPCGKTALAA
ncbi:two-component system, NarL family, sensor histidine kinase EvgS [Cupriavidus metallidurans]